MRTITTFTQLVMLLAALAAQGCCSGPKCRDLKSGADKERTRALPMQIDAVSDDRVSAPEKDATDWKTVEVKRPGTIVAELHWDNGNAKLLLSLFDVLGKEIKKGVVWGQKGQRVSQAVMGGRFYLRVQAAGADDESSYSLRVRYRRTRSKRCHNCVPGERTCLKSDGYAICRRTPFGCNAWSETQACAKDQTCRAGKCAKGCTNECKAEARRCAGRGSYQACRSGAAGCFSWSQVIDCGKGRACRKGTCKRVPKGRVVRRNTHRKTPKPNGTKKPPAGDDSTVKGKIISIYKYRGRMTLHIEIGDNSGVRPGATGMVMRGGSSKPLSGGEIKVTKVSGRFCVATTSLNKLGKNRWVRIRVR